MPNKQVFIKKTNTNLTNIKNSHHTLLNPKIILLWVQISSILYTLIYCKLSYEIIYKFPKVKLDHKVYIYKLWSNKLMQM